MRRDEKFKASGYTIATILYCVYFIIYLFFLWVTAIHTIPWVYILVLGAFNSFIYNIYLYIVAWGDTRRTMLCMRRDRNHRGHWRTWIVHTAIKSSPGKYNIYLLVKILLKFFRIRHLRMLFRIDSGVHSTCASRSYPLRQGRGSGSVDFWPTGSGSNFFSLDPDPTCNNVLFHYYFHPEQNINKNKLKMMVYKIEFYGYLHKI